MSAPEITDASGIDGNPGVPGKMAGYTPQVLRLS